MKPKFDGDNGEATTTDGGRYEKGQPFVLMYDPVRGDNIQEVEVSYYGQVEGYDVFSTPDRGIGVAWDEVYSVSLGAGVEIRHDKPNIVYECVKRSQRIGKLLDIEPIFAADGGAELGPFITPGARVADKETGKELVVVDDTMTGPVAEVMVGGKSIMEFEGNENYSVNDTPVGVVYKADLDRTVPGWDEWDAMSFTRNLAAFKKEWKVHLRTYTFPSSRLGLPEEVDE